MASLLRKRITLVWLGLILATLLSWETLSGFGPEVGPNRLGIVVLVIAFIKVRYIMLEFMELRHAPLALRLFAEGWSILVCIAVLAFYTGLAAGI